MAPKGNLIQKPRRETVLSSLVKRKISYFSDDSFLLMREKDDRFKIIAPMGDCLEDLRCPKPIRHPLVQMIRQRVYRIAADYEDCNDADYLRIDPALRLTIGKNHKVGVK